MGLSLALSEFSSNVPFAVPFAVAVIRLWRPQISDRALMRLSHGLIAAFLFLPFYWTLVRPPELLAIFMGLAAMGLGAIFFFVTAISYYWRRATKWGALATVLYGTAMTLYGGYAVLYKNAVGMGTFEWILMGGCGLLYFGVSLLTTPPSEATITLLFPARK